MLACRIVYHCANMYTRFFSLKQAPFSIAPDPRYLLMTQGHREALAHLLYGVNSSGGVVLLTGEVGAGKTTVCRCFLELVPANCNVAYIFNPKLTVNELLQLICDEFQVEFRPDRREAATVKDYVDALTRYLLATHAEGQNNVLVIDEAQNLSVDVLEQLRLLTNLETNERKLLQITLIGQPELRAILGRPELKQLAQRVIARYHLRALTEEETGSYIQHRLAVAGAHAQPFQNQLVKHIHRLTEGVPRRINLLCDRALLGAYAEDRQEVNRAIIDRAAAEVFGRERTTAARPAKSSAWRYGVVAALFFAASAAAIWSAPWPAGGIAIDRILPTAALGLVRPATATPAQGEPTATGDGSADGNASPASPPAAPATILSEADGRSELGWDRIGDGVVQLASMWGVALDAFDPCSQSLAHQLHCYTGSGGLAELRQLDRPALITLRDSEKRIYYALLTRLTDANATLQVGSAAQTVSRVILARYFQGEFRTMWRSALPYRGYVARGDHGAEVDWVAAQLAKAGAAASAAQNQPFDAAMAQQVREFQLSQGVTADGMVGPVTFMRLNRVAGLEEPRLITSPAVSAAATTY